MIYREKPKDSEKVNGALLDAVTEWSNYVALISLRLTILVIFV